ncbi:MAG: AbrB family transcriptional regulator [Candidatus Omnitrophica bacterium CG11_big_fil_rev_8_21_14_0_20_63_9]|nr:MAG: AbrB family transcriptional regulator [Candidatus Omnitrophica bacterium CG11_big_fil_rev_8_21_14_0_20_63_9]QBM01472.1 hypothetical protein [uncultured archaeon]
MIDIGVSRMSSKGQIVIPSEMRAGFKEGDKLVVIRSGNKFVLKSATAFDENLEKDLRFAERAEEALKRCEKGGVNGISGEEFLEELKKW